MAEAAFVLEVSASNTDNIFYVRFCSASIRAGRERKKFGNRI